MKRQNEFCLAGCGSEVSIYGTLCSECEKTGVNMKKITISELAREFAVYDGGDNFKGFFADQSQYDKYSKFFSEPDIFFEYEDNPNSAFAEYEVVFDEKCVVIHECDKCGTKEWTEEGTIEHWIYDGVGGSLCFSCSGGA